MYLKEKEKFGQMLRKLNVDGEVTWDELDTYLHAYTYEDDQYSVEDIFENEILLLHEIFEILCLKKKGLKITRDVIIKNRKDVYECHLNAIDKELNMALRELRRAWIKKRVDDLMSYLSDPCLPEELRDNVKNLILKYAYHLDFGIYALLIKNDISRSIKIGSLGQIQFAEGFYVYIGSAQRNLHRRISRHYSTHKKLRWHIDYFLVHAKILTHFSLPLPKEYEEKIAMRMGERFKSISGFGASDSRARSHLFYGDKGIWEYTQHLFWKCLEE